MSMSYQVRLKAVVMQKLREVNNEITVELNKPHNMEKRVNLMVFNSTVYALNMLLAEIALRINVIEITGTNLQTPIRIAPTHTESTYRMRNQPVRRNTTTPQSANPNNRTNNQNRPVFPPRDIRLTSDYENMQNQANTLNQTERQTQRGIYRLVRNANSPQSNYVSYRPTRANRR
jgi:hypothetical protein